MGLQVFVTDMNEGFSRSGLMASPRVDALVEPMADFLRGLPPGSRVVFVSDCHQPGDAEVPEVRKALRERFRRGGRAAGADRRL